MAAQRHLHHLQPHPSNCHPQWQQQACRQQPLPDWDQAASKTQTTMRRNPTAMKWGEDAPGTAGVIFFGLESLGLSGDDGEAAGGAGLVAGGNLLKVISWMLAMLQ